MRHWPGKCTQSMENVHYVSSTCQSLRGGRVHRDTREALEVFHENDESGPRGRNIRPAWGGPGGFRMRTVLELPPQEESELTKPTVQHGVQLGTQISTTSKVIPISALTDLI